MRLISLAPLAFVASTSALYTNLGCASKQQCWIPDYERSCFWKINTNAPMIGKEYPYDGDCVPTAWCKIKGHVSPALNAATGQPMEVCSE